MEFLRDLLGLPVSLGRVHHVLQAATRQASAINREQDLSGIRVGLHNEIFQGVTPVLAGVDAASTYCYLLDKGFRQDHRRRPTWAPSIRFAPPSGRATERHSLCPHRAVVEPAGLASAPTGEAVRLDPMQDLGFPNMAIPS